MFKVISKQEAAEMINNGDEVVWNSFGSLCFPEELCEAIGQRFLKTGEPKNLSYFFATAGVWDETRMIELMSYEGMVKKVISSHFTPILKIQRQVIKNEIEAYNLPLGVISHLLRASAGRKPGILTKIGLKTIMDPRNGGGALNALSKGKIIELMDINGEEYLFYKAPKPTVALLKGTTADVNGNITMEKEAVFLDPFAAAMAVKANRGKVIVQVERISSDRAVARDVKIPGIIVDAIVVEPEQYQVMIEKYNPTYTGEIRIPDKEALKLLDKVKELNIRGGTKKVRNVTHSIIARRAAMELKSGAVVNLGVGIPEMIPKAAQEIGATDNVKLTVESGAIGGYPSNGLSFGAAINVEALQDMAYQLDFYDGGGLDITFVGALQVDKIGNVNVSRVGKNIIGVGGFINLTQSAKKVVYCFPFSGSGMKVGYSNNRLSILQEGKYQKFCETVEEISASGEFSMDTRQEVMYITERCVFKLTKDGLMLIEIAPGISIEKDIVSKMPFKPLIANDIKVMDCRLFEE